MLSVDDRSGDDDLFVDRIRRWCEWAVSEGFDPVWHLTFDWPDATERVSSREA